MNVGVDLSDVVKISVWYALFTENLALVSKKRDIFYSKNTHL